MEALRWVRAALRFIFQDAFGNWRFQRERFYGMRRTDRQWIGDEWQWVQVKGPTDWESAELDCREFETEPVEYEIVQFAVKPIVRRLYPPGTSETPEGPR